MSPPIRYSSVGFKDRSQLAEKAATGLFERALSSTSRTLAGLAWSMSGGRSNQTSGHAVPGILSNSLRIPVVAAPPHVHHFANPPLVIAQCKAQLVGSFPALNARPQELLTEWLSQIEEELGTSP